MPLQAFDFRTRGCPRVTTKSHLAKALDVWRHGQPLELTALVVSFLFSQGAARICGPCGGRGVIIRQFEVAPGLTQGLSQKCEDCDGEGEIIADADRCPLCMGRKTVTGMDARMHTSSESWLPSLGCLASHFCAVCISTVRLFLRPCWTD